MIENKWKEFAVRRMLCNWSSRVSLPTLFDWIVESNEDDLPALFDDYLLCVWQPFENWDLAGVACQIFDVAEAAQNVANVEDFA